MIFFVLCGCTWVAIDRTFLVTDHIATTYSKLIPALQQLHKDLSKTDVKSCHILSKPALSFKRETIFNQTQDDKDVCEVFVKTMCKVQSKVIKVLKMICQDQQNGFKNQNRKIFGFVSEDFNELHYFLSKMNKEKLEKALFLNKVSV